MSKVKDLNMDQSVLVRYLHSPRQAPFPFPEAQGFSEGRGHESYSLRTNGKNYEIVKSTYDLQYMPGLSVDHLPETRNLEVPASIIFDENKNVLEAWSEDTGKINPQEKNDKRKWEEFLASSDGFDVMQQLEAVQLDKLTP